MNKIKFISFDYSLSSPAMCLSDGEKFEVYVVSAEKKIGGFNRDNFEVIPISYPIWDNAQERYLKLRNSLLKMIGAHSVDLDLKYGLGIEDYAFAAKGKVFHIAENTQMIKSGIYEKFGKEFLQISPNSIKKVFSDKGNADKTKMAEAFKERFGFFVHEELGGKIDGSACDIVDAIAVNIVLQDMSSGKVPYEDIFKSKVKAKPNFGELKKLKPFVTKKS